MPDRGSSPVSGSPAERTVSALLLARASDAPTSTFLRTGDEEWTFAEMIERVAARAATLREAGVGRGDRVVSLLGNGQLIVELFLACAWMGAVFVPVNSASRGPQLAHLLGDCDPSLVVTNEMFADELTAVRTTAGPLWVEAVGVAAGAGTPVPPLASAIDPEPVSAGDPVAILYTSGTTGPPKGVVCPQAQFWWWGRNTGAALELRPEDVLYTCLPLFHTNALNTLVQGLSYRVPVVVGERFSASGFWRTLIDADATVTYILGAMASILAARDPGPLDRAHRVRVALSPATPPALWDVFRDRFGIRIVEGHGMTETNIVLGPRDGEQRPGWMGRVMPGFHARVVDLEDVEVPVGSPGELVVRADEPFAFASGYWGLPEATVASWRNLWFHTGDRVVQDADGWFRFVDRIKDVIRRRGENISAWEVEQALTEHPSVAAAAAVAVPSPLGEDDVMAFVVCVESSPSPVELTTWAEERLPYFAVPRYLEYLDELPLTENGKVRKYVLRERGVTETTWDREVADVTAGASRRGRS